MNTNRIIPAGTLAVIGSVLMLGAVVAQDTADKPVSTDALSKVSAGTTEPGSPAVAKVAPKGAAPADFPGKTILDDPGANDPRLIVAVDDKGRATTPRLSKIDLDGDINHIGTIDNQDPYSQGRFEYYPPGLELGVGEVTRLLVRFKTYDLDFAGRLKVTLEVTGINRDSASGSHSAGTSGQTGRIKVWRDQARTELLLDSGESGKLAKTWTVESGKGISGLPRVVYVEGVEASTKFEGDLRLLILAEHVGGSSGDANSGQYQTAFDHMLLTVRKDPVEKEFINNNVEGVWSTVDQPAPSQPAAGAEAAAPASEAAR